MSSNRKLLYLESIRGLAALSVVFAHLMNTFEPQVIQRGPGLDAGRLDAWGVILTIFRFAFDGAFAVTLFFVLSGFVLSWSYLRNDSPAALSSSVIRRYFRLMWPSLVSVLAAWAVMKLGLMSNDRAASLLYPEVDDSWLGSWYRFTPWLREAMQEGLWGVFFNFNEQRTYNPALWTMSVELYGSFLVYCFWSLFRPIRNRWMIYVVLFVAFLYMGNMHQFAFLVGICLAEALDHRGDARTIPWAAATAGLVMALLIVGIKPGRSVNVLGIPIDLARLFDIISSLAIIGLAACSPAIQRCLNLRPLVFLGKVSFGLYLIHMTVICSLGTGLFVMIYTQNDQAYGVAIGLACLSSVVGSVVAAWVMYHLADRPSIWIGKWLFLRYFAPHRGEAEGHQ